MVMKFTKYVVAKDNSCAISCIFDDTTKPFTANVKVYSKDHVKGKKLDDKYQGLDCEYLRCLRNLSDKENYDAVNEDDFMSFVDGLS